MASKGNIPVNIEDEMRVAYMDYAMSVIVGRALSDVRDGLKPVHRRILYAMHDLSNAWNKPYKKSARVVGDVIGKYHPHGDTAVYDAIVRMAQDFSLRELLVDGQGNFGSVDGDSAAAMRYTEIRMTRLAQELLEDISKETVDFVPNYDESLKEPTVFPAKYPNLLVNGSSGIAVGMAANIPPHNLAEIIDGLIAMIDFPEIEIRSLMEYIKGPDFPTAGFIYGTEGILSAYLTGRGSIKLRARVNIENLKGDREAIIVTELPYQVNKARLIEKIAELVRDKKLEGVSELRDESDRKGMRIFIALKRGENSDVIINKLYKMTQMQESFGVIMLTLVNNQPKILDLKTMLQHFLLHRMEIVTRRTIFDLKKAEERKHILEGLKTAIGDIDLVVKIVKESSSPDEAKNGLIAAFQIDEIQAKAILDMRLHRLTGLERQKVIDELDELLKKIERFNIILSDDNEKYAIIKTELLEIKEKFGNDRRSEILLDVGELNMEDLIAEEDMVVTVTRSGYIKRNSVSLYRSQRRGGTGSKAVSMREEDLADGIFVASTHDYVLLFSTTGKVHWMKVYQIPDASRIGKGKTLASLLNLLPDERITAAVSVKEFTEDQFLIMGTEKGVVKRTSLAAFKNLRAGGIMAITIDPGDKLICVQRSDGGGHVFLGTREGQGILFKETDVRNMGRVARGVRGITLAKDDIVIGMETVTTESVILTVTENGYGKRTKITDYRIQHRGGKGIINIKVTGKNGLVACIRQVENDDGIMLITAGGTVIRMKVKEISVIGRNTQGVKLIDTKSSRKVIGAAKFEDDEENAEYSELPEDSELAEDSELPKEETGNAEDEKDET